MNTADDRIKSLEAQSNVTGIDFIYVHPNQTTLDVYFLQSGLSLPIALASDDIEIYSSEASLPTINVAGLSWILVDGRDVLHLVTTQPGDFSVYKFKINDLRLDPFYNDVPFSFKAACPSDLDCQPPEHECAPDEEVDFPINYLARDFWSYRRALLDFASQRYPAWTDRLEADAGVMMVEVLSALADEMAYYQDRISREAYLETATQRRSIRRHARLVDYSIHDGLGATVWLDVTVKPGNGGVLNPEIAAGADVFAASDNGTQINFEVGQGIEEVLQTKMYRIAAESNEFLPHLWDEDQTCLAPGTTSLYLQGHHDANLALLDQPPGQKRGKWVLLKTVPTNPSQPARLQMVRLIRVTEDHDPVFNQDITLIEWEEEQALRFEFDLTILSVRGNMVPASAGKTFTAYFLVDSTTDALTVPQLNAFRPFSFDTAVERAGHDNTFSPRFTLPGSQNAALVYLGKEASLAKPEIALREVVFSGASWTPNGTFWQAKRSLLGVNSSGPDDEHFTLDDGSWQRVVGYQRIGEEFQHRDYAMNSGATILFGDGEFGRIPERGDVFRADYRLGGGRQSNVAAGSLKASETALGAFPFIQSFTNPLPATTGVDAEAPAEIRQLAPEAFKAITYRAVRPEDYAEAAERLPWVQKAGAVFRWTGSWLTAFVTPDPKGTVVLEEKYRLALTQQMDRFRQAGREVHVRNPEYANIDLKIHICVSADGYAGEVKERVLQALLGKKGLLAKEGYFSPNRFTFGTLLQRSTLEAAIQAVPGVKAVEQIFFRRRGWFGWQAFTGLSYNPGSNVIIRVENDALHPDRGSLKLYTHGGL